MKTKITYLIMAISLMSATVLATESLPQAGPIALSIVLDTAWSNDNDMQDYQSLARQVIATLKPGDYLEILIATSSKTQIRVAQFIKSGEAQELKNITTLISKVSCPILSDVDVSKSVDFALKRLTKSDAKNSFAYAAVMVFSDGWLNDNDVIKLQQLSREFKKRNWSLCVTGTPHANKKLLLAANQGDLNFSLISDTNPVLWIGRSNIRGKSVVPQAPTPADPQSDKTKSKTNPTTTIGVEISVSQGEEQSTEVPPVAVSDDTEQKPEQPQESIPAKIDDKPTDKTLAKKDAVPSDTPSKPAKKSNMWAWLLPLIALFALLVAVLARGASKARIWKIKVGSHLSSTQQRTPCTLTAKVKDQTYHLGRIDKIGQIHIGSNTQNAIRIYEKDVAARHLKIFRRFSSLWLKNLSSKTAFIDGVPLKPAKKVRLGPSCNIKINDAITIKLQLQKPVTQNLSKQEDGHANEE
ncbi:MAG: FHA domain-containing protein [Planctomycetota bacterium]